ncbi:MAG: diguanylate cyclase domain-containing protein, partial [Acidimicrobiales bacterium]
MATLHAGGGPNLTILLLFGGLVLICENLSLQFPTAIAISPQLILVMAAIIALGRQGVVLGALAIGGCGGIVFRTIQNRRYAVTVFNVAQMALAAGGAALVADLLASHGASDWIVFALTPIAYIVVNFGLVVPAVAIRSHQPVRSVWLDVRSSIATDLLFGVLGVLLGRLYRAAGPITVLAVVGPAIVARTVFLSVVRFRQAYHRLEVLYGFSKELDRTRDEPHAVGAMLEQFRTLLIAQVAEVTVLSETGWQRTTLGPSSPRAAEQRGPGMPAEIDTLPNGPVFVDSLGGDHPVAQSLAERDISAAMLAPLRVDDRLIGTILVACPADDRMLDSEDLRLLETLANHAAVFMENNRLVTQMRFDSRHDPLTGLPNRLRFNELTTASPTPSAILLVDLDRFKEINDTLGHDHGDRLLGLAAARISEEV